MSKYTESSQENNLRIKAVVFYTITGVLFFLSFIFAFSFNFGGFIIAGIGVVVSTIFGNKYGNQYKSIVKNNLVLKTFSERFDDVSFSVKDGISKQEVVTLDLFNTGQDFYTNDLIKGSFEGVKFSQCDIKTSTTTSNGSNNTSSTTVYFHGQLYSFDFSKKTQYYHKLISRKSSAWGGKNRKIGTSKIKFEDDHFNSIFNTFTTNDHEAFYIFTPHFMEKVVKLENELRDGLTVVIIDSVLYLSVYSRKDMHEPSLMRGVDQSYIDGLHQSMDIIQGVITLLDLNNNYFKDIDII